MMQGPLSSRLAVRAYNCPTSLSRIFLDRWRHAQLDLLGKRLPPMVVITS
jgi:hypothetical protein